MLCHRAHAGHAHEAIERRHFLHNLVFTQRDDVPCPGPYQTRVYPRSNMTSEAWVPSGEVLGSVVEDMLAALPVRGAPAHLAGTLEYGHREALVLERARRGEPRHSSADHGDTMHLPVTAGIHACSVGDQVEPLQVRAGRPRAHLADDRLFRHERAVEQAQAVEESSV